MDRINVTKAFLPPLEKYQEYLQQIWDKAWLTNQGPLLQEFEKEIQSYIGVPKAHFVTNGTLALQVALRALDVTEGEVITTPFSYVATTSSILWERCTPVFVDIEPDTFGIDVTKIEAAITPKTKAIMPVHVFGYPCNVEAIKEIAEKHNLKVIYDAAHAFGAKYKGKALLDYGDISICSFHSTKLFHTIEGGCVVARDKKINDKVELIKRFGHNGDEHFMLGMNAKASEFQAAMGLCNLPFIDTIIESRKEVSAIYDRMLPTALKRPTIPKNVQYNYSYYPVVFRDEVQLLDVMKALEQENIFIRRYFYPSLNKLPYIKDAYLCPVSERISQSIACLPLYDGISHSIVEKICKLISQKVTA